MVDEWASWTQHIWERAANGWLRRDGQDHFYRDRVVLPAFSKIVVGNRSAITRLVDLGGGDGYTAAALYRLLREAGAPLEEVVVLDRLESQLAAAERIGISTNVVTVTADLLHEDWWALLAKPDHAPSLFVGVFVLQELPRLEPILKGLRQLLGPEERAWFVIVSPDYSESLRREALVRDVRVASKHDDWEWAGLYPISVPNTTLYLPHFQRSKVRLESLATNAGLEVPDWFELAVPNTSEAAAVFRPTVYGEEILHTPSSVLFSIGTQQS